MRLDASLIDLLEEVSGHAQVDLADSFDAETHRVRAGVEHPVNSGDVVFELEKVVPVLKCKDVLSLTCVNLVHNAQLPKGWVWN